jgi:hypothetical protein
MRENAAMHAGSDGHRVSATTLIPMALAAIAVLLLALLVSGGQRGTIVVEQVTWKALTFVNGKARRPPQYSSITITETSADGQEQRTFTRTSLAKPGVQYVSAGQTEQYYEAADNTIYQTTQGALQRLFAAEAHQPGHSVLRLTARMVYVPGRLSVAAQQLRAGEYRLAGHARFDGRAALVLVQTHPTQLGTPHSIDQDVSDSTMYVSPRTLDPIAEVTRQKLADATIVDSQRWRTYRVLAATPAHQWLVSLTARHPGAHIVHGASNFIRGSSSGTQASSG